MPISRSHAARTRLEDALTNLTRINFSVFLQVGNRALSEPDTPIGTISASSPHQAFSEVANLLRAVADEIDPGVLKVTMVPEDTETATYGRPVEDVDILTDPADHRD